MRKKLKPLKVILVTGFNRFVCFIVGHAWFLGMGCVRCERCGEIYKKVGV